MPLVPDALSTLLGFASSPAMVSDWVMVCWLKSGSSTSISPPLVVSATLPQRSGTARRACTDWCRCRASRNPGSRHWRRSAWRRKHRRDVASEFIVIWQLPLPQAPPQFIKLAPPPASPSALPACRWKSRRCNDLVIDRVLDVSVTVLLLEHRGDAERIGDQHGALTVSVALVVCAVSLLVVLVNVIVACRSWATACWRWY